MAAQLPPKEMLTADDVQPPDETEPMVVAKPAEPDAEDPQEHIELVRTGLVRIWIDGQRFRLRRPFFGELKKIRLRLEDVQDEITDAVEDARLVADLIVEEQTSKEHEKLGARESREWNKKKRAESREASRKLTELADSLREEWLKETWALLSVDGVPDEMPSWAVDPQLPDLLLSHWRAVPLARG